MKIVLGIVALLVILTFAMVFVSADDSVTIEDSIIIETTETLTDVVSEEVKTTEFAEVSEELERVAPTTLAPASKQRYIGLARVTLGNGFIVKSDNTEAKRISAFWISSRYISIDPIILKQLREQYKGQPAKLKQEIEKLATDKVVVKATGRLRVGFGRNTEIFKLLKKEFNNESVSFYVLPINENLAVLKDASDADISIKTIGTLTIDGTNYPTLTVWKGTLVSNSGRYSGTWDVTASSHSKVINHQNIRKAKVAIKEALVQKRPGLLRRMIFWKKANVPSTTATE